MKIVSELIQQTNQTTVNTKVNEDELKKSKPERLKEGKPMQGEICDLSQSGAKIVLSDGSEITGKLLNAENAKIGQEVNFTVKLEDGKVLIELEPESLSESEQKFLSRVLIDNGLKDSAENLKMLKDMIENKMPLNRETILKFNQAMKLVGKDGLAKALFLMNNDIRLNPKNAEALENFISGDLRLSKQFSQLTALIEKFEQPEIREAVLKIISGEAEKLNSPAPDNAAKANVNSTVTAAPATLTERLNSPIQDALANIAHPKLRESLDTQLKTIMNSLETLKPPEAKEKLLALLSKTGKENSLPAQIREAANIAESLPDKTQAKQLGEALKSLAQTAEPLAHSSGGKLFLNGLKDVFTEAAKSKAGRILRELPETKPARETLPREAAAQEALKPESEQAQKALKKLLMDFKDSDARDINKFLNEVQELMTQAKGAMVKSGAEKSPAAEKLADEIKGNLSFMNQINTPAYVQLPILLNDKPLDMELYVFTDKNKKKQNTNGVLSALIAVDLDFLGHFESYIQKKGETVSFQFRLGQENVEPLVRQNINRLRAMLQTVGCKLGSYTFKSLEQKFSLLDAEPEDMAEAAGDGSGEPKRITFDMRA